MQARKINTNQLGLEGMGDAVPPPPQNKSLIKTLSLSQTIDLVVASFCLHNLNSSTFVKFMTEKLLLLASSFNHPLSLHTEKDVMSLGTQT